MLPEPPAHTPGAPRCGLCSALCSDGCRQVLLFGPRLACHEFSLVGNTSLKKVLLCVCSCCSWRTLFCGPRYWRLLLFVSFFFFPLCPFDFPHLVCALLPVSIAPPPPPMPQLTPQIPLTGFVARVQENSKFGQAELLKGRASFLLACMAGKSDSLLFLFQKLIPSCVVVSICYWSWRAHSSIFYNMCMIITDPFKFQTANLLEKYGVKYVASASSECRSVS